METRTLTDDLLSEIGEEFVERMRRGENPTIREYATQFSAEDAREVEEFLDSIAMLEQAKTPAATTSASKKPPRDFGRYRIERTLGEGGMGAVYLAHDSQLDRKVALKTPKFSGDVDPTLVKRFYREARSAATLQHPNICPVYDVGEINGIHYISMAYIDGRPLSDLVRSGRQLPIASVLRVVRKVAIALHEAHSQGLIHRDLKPANIMIDRRNEPIVMDFGLARQFGADDSELVAAADPQTNSSASIQVEARLTMDGTVMGSPGFMAPEQLNGKHSQVGPRSDVYALGVLLFELLTGRLPFPGSGSLMSIVNSVMNDPTPNASEFRTDVGDELAKICRRAMSKKAEDRYETMQAFAVALTALLRTDAHETNRSAAAIGDSETSSDLVRIREQYELARSLHQEGEFNAAASIMEKMISGTSTPNKYVDWAQKKLPETKTQAEQDTAFSEVDALWDFEANASDLPTRGKKGKGKSRTVRSTAKTILGAVVATTAVLVIAIATRNSRRASVAKPGLNASNVATEVPEQLQQDSVGEDAEVAAMVGSTNEQSGADDRANASVDSSRPRADRPRPNRSFLPGTGAFRNVTPQERLKRFDVDRDGQLTKEELRAAPRLPQTAVIRRVIDNFQFYDQNRDGKLDPFEQGRLIGMFSRNAQGKGNGQGRRDSSNERPDDRSRPGLAE